MKGMMKNNSNNYYRLPESEQQRREEVVDRWKRSEWIVDFLRSQTSQPLEEPEWEELDQWNRRVLSV